MQSTHDTERRRIIKSMETTITARAAALRDAVVMAEREASAAQAAFKKRPQKEELLSREQASVALELAKEALADYQAASSKRDESKIDEYVRATLEASEETFLQAIAPDLDEIVRLEAELRTRIAGLTDHETRRYEAAKTVALLAEQVLGLPTEVPHPNQRYLARHHVALRFRAAYRDTQVPRVAEWLNF